jgi:hypothetical protein
MVEEIPQGKTISKVYEIDVRDSSKHRGSRLKILRSRSSWDLKLKTKNKKKRDLTINNLIKWHYNGDICNAFGYLSTSIAI